MILIYSSAIKLWWSLIEYRYDSAPYQQKIEDSQSDQPPSYKTQSSNY